MIIPPYLKAGDTVAIIATARKISREELEPALQLLQQHGLKVELGQHLFAVDRQFAGTDEQRRADLQWALDHPEIKAIIIARGGYGTVRLINGIDFSGFKQQPKWLVGYSDVTVLHNTIHQLGIASLHATMPINFLKNQEATQSLIDCLFDKPWSLQINGHVLNRSGSCGGTLVGGNLSLLFALSGTKFDLDTTDKILFIEDLDEYLYHIDRMMMQLKLSGKLSCLKGLVVGGMTEMKDNVTPFGKNAEEIILEAVQEYNYPVCFNFPAGHIDRNLALYLGKECKLDINQQTVKLNF